MFLIFFFLKKMVSIQNGLQKGQIYWGGYFVPFFQKKGELKS